MMLEFLLILLIGLVAGVFIGLLPGLPAYIGPLMLYPFLGYMSVDQILAFWLSSHIGSQYFGSVAAILLRIPGEASSMIYINDVSKITMSERFDLIRQTAWGSTIGSIFSLLVIMILYYSGSYTEFIRLSSIDIKLLLLSILIIALCWFTEHKKLSFLLFLIGFVFSEKTNYSLPNWIFKIQEYTYVADVTVFLLILGFLIIPQFLEEIVKLHEPNQFKNLKIIAKTKLNLKSIFRGSWMGSLIGLIPGPSHILAAVGAYNSYGKNQIKEKIISAESANNSATITSLLPFLYIGLPITLNEFLLNDILQVKLFMIPHDFLQPWILIPNINLIEFCFCMIVLSIIIYHFLAQRFLKYYAIFLKNMYNKLIWLFVALIGYMIYVDIAYNPVSVIPYLIALIILLIIGYKLYQHKVNVLPLLFGFILGDMISWTSYQFYQIYFY